MPKYESISPFVGFHATSAAFDHFDPAIGGAQFHVGTASQATMRGTKDSVLLMVSVYATTFIRKKDTGGWWKRPTAKEADTADGVVYLNRYEGVPPHRLDSLGLLADQLSDAEFLKRVPEARDSYGVFQPHNCRIIERIAWGSDRHNQILAYDKHCTRPFLKRHQFPLSPDQDTIERARAFCLEQWQRERATSECDLSDCRSLVARFAQDVFGGTLIGNTEHQFVRLHDGEILDIASECRAVREGKVSYDVEDSLALECSDTDRARLERWMREFSKAEKAFRANQHQTPQCSSYKTSPTPL